MASVKLTLDTRIARKDGTYPLKLSLSHKGFAFISTGIYLLKDQFLNGEIVNRKGYKSLNTTAQSMLFSAQKTILDYKLSGKLKEITISQLKNAINIQIGSYQEEEDSPYLFKDHIEKFIDSKTKKSTKDVYQYTLNKVAEFADIETLTFEDINLSWLKAFEIFMTPTCDTNSRSIHFRNIRAVFNDAINEDLISQSLYPFRKFKIKKQTTQKRSLTKDQLITLRDYPCEPHREKYRDLFMLMFYLIGVNAVDILHAKKESIVDNRFVYRREKTNRLYSIELLPEAKEIIERYPGDNYLLCFMDTYTNHKDFLHRMNDNLKEIGPVLINEKGERIRKPLFPYLTTYYTRHSWATIASKLDIPKDTIRAALGHGNNTVTDIYIDFDMTKVDKANQKISKYLSRKKK